MQTLRRADPATARAYPLPAGGPVDWHRLPAGGVRATFALPALAAGTIVTPSLALASRTPATAPDPAAYHRWTLIAEDRHWPLPAVPAQPDCGPDSSPAQPLTGTGEDAPGVSMHIDCWHLATPLPAAVLQLDLATDTPPARYLVCISARPITLDGPLPVPCGPIVGLPRPPPAFSQMTAAPAIARRICSPTCVAMVLAHYSQRDDRAAIVAECHDPASNLYGLWPLAVGAAARRGHIGAVELFADWTEPLAVLAQGIPIVASIRFESGALPGAPLDGTAGHLVVLHGAGSDMVHVNDPAAPDSASVCRQYPVAAFARAWMHRRGAAYILPPGALLS